MFVKNIHKLPSTRKYLLVAGLCMLVIAYSYSQRSLVTDYAYASRIWYNKPAINWNEALPIGNGRMGAMVYGGVSTEHIQLNEQTLWSGAPRDWNNPGAKKYLPLVREAALSGKYKVADSLSKFMQGPYTESYLPMADLFISYHGIKDSSRYSRSLSLDSAISAVHFNDGTATHSRTAFASFPDQVIVLRHSSNKKAAVSFTIELTSKLHYKIYRISDHHIVLKGKAPLHAEPVYRWWLKGDQAIQYAADDKGEGMNFEVDLLVKNEGGKITAEDNSITINDADAVNCILSAATSYNGYDHSPGLDGKDPSIDANRYLTAAAARSFAQLKQRHVSDYQPVFRRVNIDLGKSKNELLPTDERLKRMETYTDRELVATIAQYGRYILIAGSRPGGQPVNLKGIWNDRLRPEYSSNWCIDHDAQMFYYAVETNNLAEMHLPFLDFIAGIAKNGTKTAAVNYGMKGWCAHHNSDIWRQSGPVGAWGEGNPHWATWNMSGPWLSAHLFEHYLFSGDKKFLAEKAWPIMKGAAMFCLDWLIKNKSGQLISVPSVSPENTFITASNDTTQISINTTSDIALMKDLFTNCIQAAAILQTESIFSSLLKQALNKMQPYPIGSKGQLLEWSEEWKPVDPSHRHLSHLYPVFPGNEISPALTPQLSEAAKKALTLREKTNCSWGFAWKAACWARLGEADSAWQTWKYQLRYVDPQSQTSKDNYGLFPNLFNSDGKDVIMNGNGCATAVLTEMLMQSHAGAIEFLPALPEFFSDGKVKGLVARGGFVVDINWSNRALTDAVIYSRLGNECSIRTSKTIRVFAGKKEIALERRAGQVYSFKTLKGESYRIQ